MFPLEKDFLDGIERWLPFAQVAHQAMQPDQCVLSSHMAVEYSAKVLYLRQGFSPGYLSLKQILDELLPPGTLTSQLYVELNWLRQLRNRVYHEAYLPTLDESERALKAAQAAANLVLPSSRGQSPKENNE